MSSNSLLLFSLPATSLRCFYCCINVVNVEAFCPFCGKIHARPLCPHCNLSQGEWGHEVTLHRTALSPPSPRPFAVSGVSRQRALLLVRYAEGRRHVRVGHDEPAILFVSALGTKDWNNIEKWTITGCNNYFRAMPTKTRIETSTFVWPARRFYASDRSCCFFCLSLSLVRCSWSFQTLRSYLF